MILIQAPSLSAENLGTLDIRNLNAITPQCEGLSVLRVDDAFHDSEQLLLG